MNILQSNYYVLYWMQQAQRVQYNPALEKAISLSYQLSLPVLVLFVVNEKYPEANLRHYHFMFEGLVDTADYLAEKGLNFLVIKGDPITSVCAVAQNAASLVMDIGYLRYQRQWRIEISKRVSCPVYQIETDTIMKVEAIADKPLFNAFSLRKRYLKAFQEPDKFVNIIHLENTYYLKTKLVSFPKNVLRNICSDHDLHFYKDKQTFKDWLKALIPRLKLDQRVPTVNKYKGGYNQAKKLIKTFFDEHYQKYLNSKNNPAHDYQSGISPYLHFGQISVRELLLAEYEYLKQTTNISNLQEREMSETISYGVISAFHEQVVIRRELAINYCWFNEQYDEYSGLPEWARKTLREHSLDKRPYLYSIDELEQAKTHDPYWNAAQIEMVKSGKMHGYMRMYWGKKILEWSREPEEAYQITLYLNNKYELDGRDANGFAGVAWCFGNHDRPWSPRKVYGSIRSMSTKALEKKFDMQAYVQRVGQL